MAQIEGKVKILADKKTDRILGPRARVTRPPNLAEVIKKAALAMNGRAIHI